MMFDKFTVLAVLAVALLVASGYGHSTAGEEAATAATASDGGGGGVAQETTSAKHGLRGWLMTAGKRHHHEHVNDCTHGEIKGVLAWVKNKFRPASKTGTATGSPTTATDAYGYQSPEPVVIDNNNGDVVPSEPFEVEVPSENNERPAEAEGSEAQEYATDESEAVPYPITESPSEFADPNIDLRSTY